MARVTFILTITIIIVSSVPFSASVRNGPSTSFGSGAGAVVGEPVTDNCRQKTRKPCQPLQFSTCFGVKLPYGFTSNELVNENFTQNQLQNEMKRWEGLRSVPRCWAVIQPLLCSLYMPKCQDDYVELPPQELCRITKKPCAVIEKALKEWPSFFRCDNPKNFPAGCKTNTDIRELRFNISATCMAPMMKEVSTDFNYYEGFEGCALNCTNPLFTKEEHDAVSNFIKYFGGVTLGCNLFLILTFVIDWKSSKAYPSGILFNVNCWYIFAILGWLGQFLPNTKEDIVCRKDSTIRRNEPDSGENIFCPMIFAIIYFGFMSALAWLSVFAYVWFLTCNAVGRIRERIDKKKLYFKWFAFLLPLVLAILCFSFGTVDGSSVTGVCFVGINDWQARFFLFILPILVAVTFQLFFFGRGIYRLWSVSLSSDFIPKKGRTFIKSNAVRALLFSLGLVGDVVASLYYQYRLMSEKPVWERSLEEYIYCKMNLTDVAECVISDKADVSLIIGNVAVFFVGGVLVSCWAWTCASVRTWKRWFQRRCDTEEDDYMGGHQGHHGGHGQMAKHKLIAQAFNKRHQISAKGRLSLSLRSTHDDPIGLNRLLDPTHLCEKDLEQSHQLNGGESSVNGGMGGGGDGDSSNINSEWAAALPHLVQRRDAIVPPHSSNSVSCVSEAETSRRPSCDSTAMSEVHVGGRGYKKSRRDFFRMSKRRSGGGGGKGWGYPWRRGGGGGGSCSSLESAPGSQILPAITALIDKQLRRGGEGDGGGGGVGQMQQKAIILKEMAIQTSWDKLPVLHKQVAMFDKATQMSLVSLQEIGTQTKKSATKKKERKEKGSRKGGGGSGGSKGDGGGREEEEDMNEKSNLAVMKDEEDAVMKLLSPLP